MSSGPIVLSVLTRTVGHKMEGIHSNRALTVQDMCTINVVQVLSTMNKPRVVSA